MRTIGDMEDLNLGMGLVMRPRDSIPAKSINLEGYSNFSQAAEPKNYIFLIAGVLILLFLLK